MSNPNLFNAQTITGKTALANVTTSIATPVTNAADSNTIVKVNSVIFSNAGSSDATVTAEVRRNSISYNIVYNVTLPTNASLLAAGRDHSFYLEEGDSLRVVSSVDSGISAIVSYDILG